MDGNGKFKPSTQDIQYACNNTRHLNKTAWFWKKNSSPARVDFSRICHSCSVFKNQSTSAQVPNYGIRHLILDAYFLKLTHGLGCHLVASALPGANASIKAMEVLLQEACPMSGKSESVTE